MATVYPSLQDTTLRDVNQSYAAEERQKGALNMLS
jgi:Zn/Cd-binding protein ZinT